MNDMTVESMLEIIPVIAYMSWDLWVVMEAL
jgi:hypothetical protein